MCERCAGTTAHKKDECRGCLVHNPLTAARLHEALALQLRHSSIGEYTSGTPDRSPGVNAAVVEARTLIERTLRRLAALIVAERGFSPPTRWVVDRRPVGFIGPLQRRRYADTSMPALAQLVSTSAEWLASHPRAAEHVQALREASHGRTWSLAYPVGPTRLHIGYCPLAVTWLVDEGGGQKVVEGRCDGRLDWDGRSALVHCPGCGTDETVEWWQREIVGDHGGEVTAAVAATWLSLHWYRDVRPSVISNWASRGKVARVMDGDEADAKPRRDGRGRALYRLADVKACAERTWGLQPNARGRAA